MAKYCFFESIADNAPEGQIYQEYPGRGADMPSRNIIKEYHRDGYYHVYNRGVEKRNIFTCEADKLVFLSYLKDYLTPKDKESLMEISNDSNKNGYERDMARKLLRRNNFAGQIDLFAFCLMPNHFHLLLRQRTERAMETFMKSLCTRYVKYFNKSHSERVGVLFQDTYKAVYVGTEELLLHLTRYIHRNPISLPGVSWESSEWPSSYGNYLGKINQSWVKTEEILGYFAKNGVNSYQDFVEGQEYEEETLKIISRVVLE